MQHVVAEVGELLRETQLRLAAAQTLVRLLAQRDVVDEADEARRDGAGYLTDGQLAREHRTVPALSDHFATDADDAGFPRAVVPLQVTVVLGVEGLRHQHGDVAADHFVGAVAEDALRGTAELLDDAAVVDDDDGVDRRVEQRPQIEIRPAGALRAVPAGSWRAVVEQDVLRLWYQRRES
jgi:hypothetical protein